MKKVDKLNLYEILLVISIVMGSGLSFHKIYLYHILLVINLLIIIIYINKLKLYFINNKVILIFFLYSFFHLFFSKDFILAIRNQIYIICGISIFFTIKFLLKRNSSHVLKIIKNCFLFSCLIGSFEAFQVFRWYTSLYEIDSSYASTFYGNTNNYATVLIIFFPFMLLKKNSLKKFFLISIVIFLLFSCDSRTNNIAVVVEIILFVLFKFIKSKAYKKSLIILEIIIVLQFVKEKIYSSYLLLFELYNSDPTGKGSVGIRKMLILNLFSELKKVEVFLFGIGGGNAALIQKLNNPKNELMASHSFFLELLVEYGIFIFILLGSYYLTLIYKNLKIYLKNNNYINGSLFISLIGFAIGLNSMSTVIYFFPFWCLLGVADFYVRKGVRV